jgi:hypothetical protein
MGLLGGHIVKKRPGIPFNALLSYQQSIFFATAAGRAPAARLLNR